MEFIVILILFAIILSFLNGIVSGVLGTLSIALDIFLFGIKSLGFVIGLIILIMAILKVILSLM